MTTKFFTPISDRSSVDSALACTGLADWEPEKVPMYTSEGSEVQGHSLLTGRGRQQLDVIGQDHAIYTNRDMMTDMFRLGEQTNTKPCGVNVLKGGEDLLIHIPIRSFDIAGDTTDMYVSARDNRCGKRSFELSAVSYRLICSNGMIISDVKGQIKNKHTVRFHDRLPDMYRAFQTALEQCDRIEDFSKRLAGWRTAGMATNLSLVEQAHELMSPKPKDTAAQKQKDRWERAKIAFVENVGEIYNSPTCQTEATRGTAFGIFNALTEYIDRPSNGRVKDRTAYRFTAESRGTKMKDDLVQLFESSLALASI